MSDKMKFTQNNVTIIGYVYGHKLEEKTVQNSESKNYGKPYISGSVDIMTDPEYKNIVTVHYTFVTEVYAKSGKKNSTYTLLKEIMAKNATVLESGIENAAYVKADTSLSVNDFYSDRNGEVSLVSSRRLEGGFLSRVNPDSNPYCNDFQASVLLTKVRAVEPNEERQLPGYAEFSGYVFDYRGAFLPVVFRGRDEKKIAFAEQYTEEITEKKPVYCIVYGKVVQSTEEYTVVTEGVFGDIEETKTRRINELRLTNITKTSAYEEALEEADEAIKTGLQNREIYLTELRAQYDQRQAAKGAAVDAGLPFTGGSEPKPAVNTVNVGAFNF